MWSSHSHVIPRDHESNENCLQDWHRIVSTHHQIKSWHKLSDEQLSRSAYHCWEELWYTEVHVSAYRYMKFVKWIAISGSVCNLRKVIRIYKSSYHFVWKLSNISDHMWNDRSYVQWSSIRPIANPWSNYANYGYDEYLQLMINSQVFCWCILSIWLHRW